MLTKKLLTELYVQRHKSLQEIADRINCSVHKVKYWMAQHGISRRSISEAVYLKNNPHGDPFQWRAPKTKQDAILFGLGLGLYWGEGTKANLTSVRLGNTDPQLIKKFIEFLVRCFGVDKKDLKFGLQIFTDIKIEEALDFWTKSIRIKQDQFYKPTVTISGSIGTYRQKSRYGVLTVHYHRKKLRDLLMQKLADVAQWQSNSMVDRYGAISRPKTRPR